eukprot:GILI01020936.1.p1 GENE.GILI01020936.1~~GILI01020936.1.p1  ORF type:complete len:256 (-),score=34.10 GILI01020936.1:55-783(-)
MMRRVSSISVTRLATNVCAVSFHTGHLLRNKNDDQAELERERALREKFAQKIGGFANVNTASNTSSSSSSNGGNNSNTNQTNSTLPPGGGFMRILFFISSIYMLVLIAQLENPNSAISMFQGMKFWQVPTDTVAYLALMRTVLSYREQGRLKAEYEEAQKRDPNLTIPMFFQTKYPAVFQGNKASQQQIVAAVAACLAATRDISLLGSMQRSVGWGRDPRASVDSIMDGLYKEFPHVFAPIQ